VRVWLASPLGFLIGLTLGALGAGGSILAVPVLVYAAGQDPREATATSLFLVGSAALVGVAAHWRDGRVKLSTGVVFGLTGVGGSLLGTAVNRGIDEDLLLLGFSGLMLLAAWRMRVGCPTCTKVGEQREVAPPPGGGVATAVRAPTRSAASRAVVVVLAGTAVGFISGLFGVGGGFVIVPALTLLLGLAMPQAIGTSLLVIAINAAVALAGRAASATIDWAVTIPFTVAAMSGVLAGGHVADRLDADRSLRWFSALLVAVATYTAVQAVMGLR
jgi:uncharacterized membrane protein YfcA